MCKSGQWGEGMQGGSEGANSLSLLQIRSCTTGAEQGGDAHQIPDQRQLLS